VGLVWRWLWSERTTPLGIVCLIIHRMELDVAFHTLSKGVLPQAVALVYGRIGLRRLMSDGLYEYDSDDRRMNEQTVMPHWTLTMLSGYSFMRDWKSNALCSALLIAVVGSPGERGLCIFLSRLLFNCESLMLYLEYIQLARTCIVNSERYIYSSYSTSKENILIFKIF
jgi:hypothetical protein